MQCGLVAFVASHAVSLNHVHFLPLLDPVGDWGEGVTLLSTLRMRRRCCGLAPC